MTEPENPEPTPLTVVGIGASSGGLAALREFFSRVPADSGLAYVVVVHLAPDHESHLAELLRTVGVIAVEQVIGATSLKPDHAYIIPPGAYLTADDGRLRLVALDPQRHERGPIDHFFRTLAVAAQDHAVAVVLTGNGSDGTLGLKAIKEHGGLILAQDPGDAEFDAMPRSAISTGLVDVVLPVAELPGQILRLSKGPTLDESEGPATDERLLMQKLFTLVRARTQRDFSRYKRSTVARRIQRRMQLHEISTLSDYVQFLRDHPEEAVALADEFLITVTSFFRDPDVFASIERKVIPRLLEGKRGSDVLRVWSVGCATGEEAYSLAILLLEATAKLEDPPQVRLFASDLHEASLKVAREGLYTGLIEADVSPERLAAFFVPTEGGHRIRDEVRERIVFAKHNMLTDPPFSKIDLLVCRNVLIYLEREVQREVLSLFHYALNPGGALVLGRSEGSDDHRLFYAEEKASGIHRRWNTPIREARLPFFMNPAPRSGGTGEVGDAAATAASTYAAMHERLIEHHAQRDAAPGGRALGRVVQQVRHDLRHPDRVGLDLDRAVGQLDREVEAERLQERHRRLDRTVHDLAQVRLLAVQDDLAVRDARDVEEVVHQPHEGAGLALHDGLRARPGLGLVGARPHRDGVAERRDRVPQLVRERRDEFVLASGLDPHRLLGPAQRRDVPEAEQDPRDVFQTPTADEHGALADPLEAMGDQVVLEGVARGQHVLEQPAEGGLIPLTVPEPMEQTPLGVLRSDPEMLVERAVGRSHAEVRREDHEGLGHRVHDLLGITPRGEHLLRGPLLARDVDEGQHDAADAVLGRPVRPHPDEVPATRFVLHLALEGLEPREDLPGVVGEPRIRQAMRQVRDGTPHVGLADVEEFADPRREALDPELAVEEEGRDVGRDHQVLEIGAQLRELLDALTVLLVDRRELLVRGLQFFPRRLELFHGRAQFLVARLQLLVRRLHLLLARLVLLDDRLQPVARERELGPQIPDCLIVLGGPEPRGPRGHGVVAHVENDENVSGALRRDVGRAHVEDDGRRHPLDLHVDRFRAARRASDARLVERGVEVDAEFVEHQLEDAGGRLALRHPQEAPRVLRHVHDPVRGSDEHARRRVTVVADEACVSIRDSGIGIPEEVLPRIFELFAQGENLPDPQGGLGIGLTLVRAVVELHGGRVEARSEGRGRGSEFLVRLPRIEDPGPSRAASIAPSGAAARPADSSGGGRRVRVLVVDDNRDAADGLSALLEHDGHEVRVAYGGAEALELLEDFRAGVALVDLGMPGMDGLEFAREVRARPALRGVRLVAVTGWGEPAARERSAAAGFDEHHVKPVAPEALAALLERAATLRHDP